jgi:sulfate transport system substrate-binding protein
VTPSDQHPCRAASCRRRQGGREEGTKAIAEAYLQFLYTAEGQEIAAKNHYRPRDEKVAAKYAGTFAKVELFTIDQAFGGWQNAQKTHFADGGTFDKIYRPGR